WPRDGRISLQTHPRPGARRHPGEVCDAADETRSPQYLVLENNWIEKLVRSFDERCRKFGPVAAVIDKCGCAGVYVEIVNPVPRNSGDIDTILAVNRRARLALGLAERDEERERQNQQLQLS